MDIKLAEKYQPKWWSNLGSIITDRLHESTVGARKKSAVSATWFYKYVISLKAFVFIVKNYNLISFFFNLLTLRQGV